MKTDKPAAGSGKTKFNREKRRGTSWTVAREKAMKDGSWSPGKDWQPKEDGK